MYSLSESLRCKPSLEVFHRDPAALNISSAVSVSTSPTDVHRKTSQTRYTEVKRRHRVGRVESRTSMPVNRRQANQTTCHVFSRHNFHKQAIRNFWQSSSDEVNSRNKTRQDVLFHCGSQEAGLVKYDKYTCKK